MKPRLDIFGWFDDKYSTTPAHDPGVETICPVCAKQLGPERVTISLAVYRPRRRSYFFRADKECWNGLTCEEQSKIESSLIDSLIESNNETKA